MGLGNHSKAGYTSLLIIAVTSIRLSRTTVKWDASLGLISHY